MLVYQKVRLRLAEINAFLGREYWGYCDDSTARCGGAADGEFSSIVEAHNAAQMESIRVFAMVQPVTNVLNGLAMGTLIALGGYWVVRGRISIGILVAFLGYLRNLFQPVRDLVEKYNTFLSAMVSAERIAGIIDEASEWETNGEVSLHAEGAPQEIRFEKVSFQYPVRPIRALNEVSFHLPAGTSLAVVGATGSGKSTLVRTLSFVLRAK